MSSTNNNTKSLYILYKPIDFQWVTKLTNDLREKYDYQHEIILVPLSNDLSKKTFVIAHHVMIKTLDIFNNLLNVSEITSLSFDDTTHMPKYPAHSVILTEYNHVTDELEKSIWASNKYSDDIGTFASKKLRHAQLMKALSKLNNYNN